MSHSSRKDDKDDDVYNELGNTLLNNSNNDLEFVESISGKASDELYLILRTFCQMV